jgi:hypothetical protein
MNVVHLARTPVAGVPAVLSRAMSKYLGVRSRSAQMRSSYPDGRVFPCDISYGSPESADIVQGADVVFIHNGVGDKKLLDMIKNKHVILMCHSQPNHIEPESKQIAAVIAVLAQYHPRLYTGKIALVPNIIDIFDRHYAPVCKYEQTHVAFSPSNVRRWDLNSDYKWDNKGYDETKSILEKSKIKFNILTGIPIERLLPERGRHHILIDELVTGSYHRASLEGASQQQMVLNSCDRITLRAVREITGCDTVPFLIVRMNELAGVLDQAKRCRDWVDDEGERARKWMEEHWNPKNLLEEWYLPLLKNEKIKWFSSETLFR